MAKAKAFALEESFLDEGDSCEHDEESIEFIMAKAKAFEFHESVIDEEEQKHNEESLECIMAQLKHLSWKKACYMKKFKFEEFLVDEDCAVHAV